LEEHVLSFLTDPDISRKSSENELKMIQASLLLSPKDIKEIFKARDALKLKAEAFN